ncbi:GDSL family lipase [Sphingomonas sp. ABOLD]|uniref:Lysophospholipase L1-like esterase n=1 Tax=Sphingomonas trueperi TaxID=53317 RepID=A0A7X6BDU3_9SPHN|nr:MULTISPECIES: GDSL-type esterase/lipase family protein [Sphingomonas]NJB99499.1 lysophospholipase L1-like esterase [Sphingomonas trueperi]RSV33465.1 GDSL family lipase [Sphingomonas sp. ABOLE]RSV43803.1 GDSL family lipase [Sphingomonas sp. ABOLD]
MIRVVAPLLALLVAGAADPQQPYRSSPERRTVDDRREWGPWLGPFRAKLAPSMLQDFGERYLYAAANAALPPPKRGEERVVFIGDSITDGWDLARSFPGKPYVNRGIGSQVTAQMLVRFEQDVVALHPRAVVILGGVNDVTGFLQIETVDSIVANVEAMADIATAHGIAVVLCSILPVNDYGDAARAVVKERKPAELRRINAALRALAAKRHFAFADYDAVLADDTGRMRAAYTRDGIHPLPDGYARMAPVAAKAIRIALRPPRTSR